MADNKYVKVSKRHLSHFCSLPAFFLQAACVLRNVNVEHRTNDQGHYHILHFCQYLRVQYASNICQVICDIYLSKCDSGCWINSHFVIGRIFLGSYSGGGGSPGECNCMRSQWWWKREYWENWQWTSKAHSMHYNVIQKGLHLWTYDSTLTQPGAENSVFQPSHSGLKSLLQSSEIRYSVLRQRRGKWHHYYSILHHDILPFQ